ncbi:MgtC/SapB family protein [Lipingzhangella sp. LS1_29]|uniref:MgtC/SapB family protein n=1 Tax=Lipingzhangella rawalii TaxID=2055835 RepID=A0ABU2H1P6_9ACTN|nr:MgtC/SapB family protein [Lipingzhangella rawalii]MDS1269216.1 MgtC/SapB family protein [Lipingzhangella rawalii]
MALAKVAAAVLLGGIIGFEREVEAQRAGLRTHILVALGAVLFTLAGLTIDDISPSRLAAQVASGIGFLGAGAILREGLTVHGLTTAASLWVTAAMGVAVGLGSWTAALAAAVIAPLVLRVLKRASAELTVNRPNQLVTLELSPDQDPVDLAAEVNSRLPGSTATRLMTTTEGSTLQLMVRAPRTQPVTTLNSQLRDLPGVHSVTIGNPPT